MPLLSLALLAIGMNNYSCETHGDVDVTGRPNKVWFQHVSSAGSSLETEHIQEGQLARVFVCFCGGTSFQLVHWSRDVLFP